MTNPETKSRRGCLAAGIIAAVLLLPPAYGLSIGPVQWLFLSGHISIEMYEAYI